MTRAVFRLALFFIGAVAVSSAWADDDHDEDHDDVRSALKRGEIVALSEILPDLEARTGARLIDAELERWRGRLVYEIVLITPDGRLLDVIVDAATGDTLDGRGYRWGRRWDHGGEPGRGDAESGDDGAERD